MEKIKQAVEAAVSKLFNVETDVALSRPDEQFGDFACNVALQLAAKVGDSPRQIAEKLQAELATNGYAVEIAGPGFLNFKLSDEQLAEVVKTVIEQKTDYGRNRVYQDQVIVSEYSDLNAFKTAHAGHLYTTLVGDAISNLLEIGGAKVHRVNFGGDVGLHVGRSMWAIMKNIGGDPTKLDQVPENERANWVAARYVEGTAAYENDETAKQEIIDCNKHAYQVQADQDHDSDFAKVYWMCRTWSYDGFEKFYDQLQIYKDPVDGKHFVYYPESLTAPIGLAKVEEGKAAGVFIESDGALVYPGEQDGLHTRVFLTREGLPTYEAKDLGLAIKKWQDYHFDLSISITGNEIVEYMKVVQAALRHFEPEIADRSRHIAHGMILLEGGAKMSSRKGTVVLPEQVIAAATEANKALTDKDAPETVLAAIKYSFLKQRVGGDIVYNAEESVSILGNSGPYLQYAHARACSIVGKSTITAADYTFDASERSLVRKISEYPEVVELAARELMPHHICSYLYELAQTFNRFYENERVIGDKREAARLSLINAYRQVLANGLKLLGITAPQSM